MLSLWLSCLVSLLAGSKSINFQNDIIIQSRYNSNNFQYKGVCLGGWLVLEPYITPSLFLEFNKTKNSSESDIPLDEYHFCKKLGYKEAQKRLIKHWETWYTESDFKEIKKYGLNMVRIPIGYWSLEKLPDDPYVTGAEYYLDIALLWAKKYDLKVWIDLHGMPGSQNGFDNSGYRNINYPGWFNKTEHIDLSHKVLHKIFLKYGGFESSLNYKDILLGIQIVNEPFSPILSIDKIKDFYKKSYQDARKIQLLNNTIIFHDAFTPIGYWNDFLSKPSNENNETIKNYNILIDHHHYEVFSADTLNESIEKHLKNIKDYSSSISEKELKYHPAVVGEWSAALTDCTPWLNGVGMGTRYEGTYPYTNKRIGDCSNINNWSEWSDNQRKNYRKFIEIQLYEYSSKMNGYIFWCFKTETSIEWDFRRLVKLGLMPQPLDNFTYIANSTDTDKPKNKNSSNRLANNLVYNILFAISIQLIIIFV